MIVCVRTVSEDFQVHRRKAFTVIELLIVIGILALLAGVVVWGLKSASTSNAGKATRSTLQNLVSMQEELNRKNKLAGFELIYPTSPPSTLPAPEIAPGVVNDDSKTTDRFGPAVGRTSTVITRLAAIPANKQILDKLPADQLMPYVAPGAAAQTGVVPLDGWRNPIIFVPAAGLENVRSSQSDSFTSGMTYARGARVVYQGEVWTANGSITTPPASPAWFKGIRSPDGRPFWASAGPDEDFGGTDTTGFVGTKGSGDDNIYSFEH
jgi:prepilin-type N-terminal cleavage/methylation domain-containing protein